MGFTLSCFLLYIAEKQKRINLIFIIISLFSIWIPCLIAGLRADSIGTDVLIYAKPLYQLAEDAGSFSDFMTMRWYSVWRYKYVTEFEPGFCVLVYLSTKLFHSFGAVLFAIEACVVVPVWIGLVRQKDKISTALGMFVFYMLFFNCSLNIMRQSIAMAFLFLGFSYLIDKSKMKYLCFVIIAFLFHKSALIGLLILVLSYFLEGNYAVGCQIKKLRFHMGAANIKEFRIGRITFHSRIVRILLIAAAGFGALLFLSVIFRVLSAVGLSFVRQYIVGNIQILPKQLLLRIPILLLFAMNWKKIQKESDMASLYVVMLILDLIASQLASIYEQSARIAFYFSEYNIFSYPLLIKTFENGKWKFIKYFIILYLIAYWMYQFVISGAHQTFPYVFR